MRRSSASFAAAVVLPEPWSPASRITVGGLLANASFESPLPMSVGQLVVDDLDDLLAGREALRHVGAERARPHALDEVLDDLEVDVGLEQREPDLAHRARDRVLVELPAAADVVQSRLEPV